MARYEEIAELASDINTKLDTKLQPDTLVYLLESFLVDDETPVAEISIGELTEHVYDLLHLGDAVILALDGESLQYIEEAQDDLNDALKVGE
jgi:uncharacterized protein YheU (UPF0270 family)